MSDNTFRFDPVDIVMMSDPILSEALENIDNAIEISENVDIDHILKESGVPIELGFEDDLAEEIDYDEAQDDSTDPLDQFAEDYRKSRDEEGPVNDDSDGEMIDNLIDDDMVEDDEEEE